ncbi:ATP-binding protein [Shewanella surugensis]|uniref:histidine kinase n=1 Tax=Shewanella surugensis TaxID=212020 RepID=A0ABT0LFR0_9GAMM|nr:ATP-binding protein [Shewanella surugensis]MCL1125991.1 ATP-binding protein [Shewanella surugensis]
MDLEKKNQLLNKKITRENAARKFAEKLLEEKSLELYYANEQLQHALTHVQTKLKHDSTLLAYKAKMDSNLLNFSRLFLKKSPTPRLLQELVDTLTDDSSLSDMHIHIELKADDIVHFSHSCMAGRIQTWTPPKDLFSQNTYWDETNKFFWVALANQADCYMAGRITAYNSWLMPIQKYLSLIGEILTAAFIRHLTLIQEVNARKQAEDSEKASQNFLAMINHELRTPLNGLLGSAELLADTELQEDQRKLLTTLNSSGELLRNIINDLLDYSKMSANMFELIEGMFNIEEVANLLRAIFNHSAQEKGLTFIVNCADLVPRYLIGDVDRIKQICVNLIGNAIKFTDKGGIDINFDWQKGQLIFSVTDTGTGIKASDINLLFKPFSQIDLSSKKAHEGTGLGLSICKKLSQLMDGNINVTSQIGKGSTFSVTLPLSVSDKASKKTIQTDEIKASLEGMKILVVEDVKTNQMIINLMLKKLNLAPQFADNGLDALEQLKSRDFDIILMDCRMPIMDGFTATATLRHQGYSKPIIALTAGTTSIEREQCLTAGMDDILFKPYKLQEIQATLSQWCQPHSPV